MWESTGPGSDDVLVRERVLLLLILLLKFYYSFTTHFITYMLYVVINGAGSDAVGVLVGEGPLEEVYIINTVLPFVHRLVLQHAACRGAERSVSSAERLVRFSLLPFVRRLACNMPATSPAVAEHKRSRGFS